MREQIEIKKLGINGEGIGYLNKKVVFIPGTLPGELVEIKVKEQKGSFYKAELVKVIKSSRDRIRSCCVLDDRCQGCSYLHLNYSSQLVAKKEAVLESLRKYTNFDLSGVIFNDTLSPETKTGFEKEINLPIVNFHDKITFGIYQRETKFLTIMTQCFKIDPLIVKVLKELEDIINKNHLKTYSDRFKTGLRFIKAREIAGKIEVILITGRDGLSEQVIKEIKGIKEIVALYLSVNTRKYQDFTDGGYKRIFGKARIEYSYFEANYLLSVKEQLAKNREAGLIIDKQIVGLLTDSRNVLSINSGLAYLEMNLPMKVTCLEENKIYQENNKLNAKYQDHIVFKYGNIDNLVVNQAKTRKYDTFLIKNERYGLSDKIKTSILKANVENIVYLNQSHSTLAKDLADLEKQYRLKQVITIDSDLYTPYVTTIVKLIHR